MFLAELPIIDLRDQTAYQQGHWKGATHLEWPTLTSQLNQLPAAPVKLQLLGSDAQLKDAKAFLVDKGYDIGFCMSNEVFEFIKTRSNDFIETGATSKRLWQPTPLLIEFLQEHSKTGKALDIGCGGGRDSVFLSIKGYQVTAIDNKQRVLDRAQQLAAKHQQQIEWRCCNVNQLGCLPDEKFDLIVVVRYLNRDLFDWIQSHLNEQGYLLFQTFTEGVQSFDSPKNPNFILKKGELSQTFSEMKKIVDRIDFLNDGRPVASFIGQKRQDYHHAKYDS